MDRLLEFHRRFAPVLVLVVAVACAPTPAPPGADEAPFAGDDAADVFAAGYSMKASTRVLCGHIDEDGTVLWPERAA